MGAGARRGARRARLLTGVVRTVSGTRGQFGAGLEAGKAAGRHGALAAGGRSLDGGRGQLEGPGGVPAPAARARGAGGPGLCGRAVGGVLGVVAAWFVGELLMWELLRKRMPRRKELRLPRGWRCAFCLLVAGRRGSGRGWPPRCQGVSSRHVVGPRCPGCLAGDWLGLGVLRFASCAGRCWVSGCGLRIGRGWISSLLISVAVTGRLTCVPRWG